MDVGIEVGCLGWLGLCVPRVRDSSAFVYPTQPAYGVEVGIGVHLLHHSFDKSAFEYFAVGVQGEDEGGSNGLDCDVHCRAVA